MASGYSPNGRATACDVATADWSTSWTFGFKVGRFNSNRAATIELQHELASDVVFPYPRIINEH